MKKLFLSIILLFASNIYSQNYILDNSFGINGAKKYFGTSSGQLGNPETPPTAVFYQNNKYILVQDYQIASFTYEGNRDLTFGTNGKLILSTSSSNSYAITGGKLVNDKIYVFGYHKSPHIRNAFIARVLLNGTFDTTFGNAGISFFDIGQADNVYEDDEDSFNDIKVNDDGTIYAVGQTTTLTPEPFFPGQHSNPIFTLSKITSSQTLDTTFASNGYIGFGTGHGQKILDFQGQMLLAGQVYATGPSYPKLALVSNTGSLVTSFGDGGIKNLTSYSGSTFSNAFIFNENTLYASFILGSAGAVYGQVKGIDLSTFLATPTIQTGGNAELTENGGKIYIADGTCPSCDSSDFRVKRLNSDGTLDTTFDNDGQITYTFPSVFNPKSFASEIYVHDDGKIFMAGYAKTLLVNDTGEGMGMIRLEPASLGTSEFSKSFSIAQNPVSQTLHIVNNKETEISSVAIIDNNGRTLSIREGNLDHIDVSFLQEGMYYLKIFSENKYQTIKFLKAN